ncbi:MAG: polyprenyl synthetase family protein [Candidatus Dormibacteraeota bacterium]|nr:polyprenyl synthetase family protein [Candidatus Dormibacteraeota bacterium]
MGPSLGAGPFALVGQDLADLEAAAMESIRADGPPMATAMGPLFEAGGKRLRPALVFLSGRLGSFRSEHLSAAMAVELVHAATLVHDDLIDRATLRRGRPTVAHLLGPAPAIVIGDFYFAKAYEHAARTGEAAVVGEIARAVMRICSGELDQDSSRYRYGATLDEYIARIDAKTAALLVASCWVGGWLGGLGDAELTCLRDYGRELGLAFQIVDDVLDYTAASTDLGKPVAKDLAEGYATLPLLLTELTEHLPDGRQLDQATVERVAAQVRAGGGAERALETARSHSHRAAAALANLPSGSAREALLELTEFVVERGL